MKKLSIIVPCFNSEKYIGRCLDSLMNQDFDDFVVLVIDDGSTDRSAAIISDFQQRYPQRIDYFYQKNSGIACARNAGLDQVKTEYFGFLDSDDYVRPQMFSRLLKKAEQTQADLVACGFEWVYEGSRKKNTLTQEGPYAPGKEMMLGLFAVLWNKVYRTEFVRSTGLRFLNGYRYEDASFLYRLVPYVRKVDFLLEPYIFYVQRPGSITHTHNEKVKDMVFVFQDILDFYQKNGFYEDYQRELEYIFIRFFLGNSFLRSVQIKDKEDRQLTMKLSWDMLNEHFPEWKKNPYLHQGGLKNLYYQWVNRRNYMIFGKLFSWIRRG